MKRLAVFGASGHGRVVADAAEASGWHHVVFFDDAWPEISESGPWRVEGDFSAMCSRLPEFDGIFVAIGNNHVRHQKTRELIDAGAGIETLVHPCAYVSQHARLGAGCVVLAAAAVNAGAVVGEGGIINTGAVIEHDCQLGDFVHVSPNAVLAGGVKAGDFCWVGALAGVRQLISLGKEVTVGMGAVVIRDIPKGATVAGVPAVLIRSEPGHA